jgi:hypothetical protein
MSEALNAGPLLEEPLVICDHKKHSYGQSGCFRCIDDELLEKLIIHRMSDILGFHETHFDELSESQQNKLDEWKGHIKAVFGEYGDYEFIFKPNGVGMSVSVYSCLADRELDLTEIENW